MAKELNEQEKKQVGPDYLGLFKKAFGIVWKAKYLWFLGLLSAGSFMPSFNFPAGVGQNNSGKATLDFQYFSSQVMQWIQNNLFLVGMAVSGIVVFFLCFLVISIMAKAGLIFSVDEISKSGKNSVGLAFKYGWHKFWRLLGLSVLIGLIMLAFILVLLVVGAGLWSVKPLFILFVILAVLALIFVAVLFGITFEYAARYATLKDKKAIDALMGGIRLIFERKKETFLLWLATVAIAIVFGMGLAIGIIFLILVLVLLGLAVFFLAPVLIIFFIALSAFVFLAAALVAAGFISSLTSAYWTLAFNEIG